MTKSTESLKFKLKTKTQIIKYFFFLNKYKNTGNFWLNYAL